MKLPIAVSTLLFLAAPSLAQGPWLAPVPANTCPGARALTTRWIANQVGTDAGGAACGVGGGCAETLVACTHKGSATSAPIDVFVQMFDATGALAATGSLCGVLPGAGAPFVTNNTVLPPGYTFAVFMPPGLPVVPLGSLRVLTAGGNRAVCDVTLIDTSGPVLGATAVGPAWTKDVTVTYRGNAHKGD